MKNRKEPTLIWRSLSFCLLALYAANLAALDLQEKRISQQGYSRDSSAFVETAKRLSEGDPQQCRGANGVWQVSEPSGSQHQIRLTPLRGDLLTLSLINSSIDFKQIYAVELLKNGSFNYSEFMGLLLDTTSGWRFVQKKNMLALNILARHIHGGVNQLPSHLFVPLSNQFKSVLSAANADANEQMPVSFDSRMLTGKWGQATTKYLGIKSVESFLQVTEALQGESVLAEGTIPSRVVPEMYEILEDTDYVVAKKYLRYTTMIDIIWNKALALAKGDTFKASFMALQLTDARSRGVCGAIYGIRGRSVLPPGIFDGELPSELRRQRLDSLQHFFGYTLVGLMQAGQVIGTVTTWQAAFRKRYLPFTANMFRDRHDIADGSGDRTLGISYDPSPGLAVMLRGANYEVERTQNDVDLDSFYNDLGLQFAKRLAQSPTSQPSEVINSEQNEIRKVQLGLGTTLQPPWQAYDPAREVERGLPVPEDQRISPQHSLSEALASAKDNSERLKISMLYCQTHTSLARRRIACKFHDSLYAEVLERLYRKNHIEVAERVKYGWLSPTALEKTQGNSQ